ncbi:uncharacterized protein LOC118644312 isoform X1 [Monomorium pharaonis]|uniref:uncharacterized protein LOC118644312 isoform X1 n=1 Tax=Monomorium pharaonis TaxID=307658 RepID=UPI0017475B79|nr:uncharacterized protein LOC118644312 isoform X1 [Monomorium pharaonis]
MAEPVEGQPTGDSPCVSSDVTSENAHKKMKISVSEQAFDSAIKEFMEKEHPATTEWSIVKDRKSVSSRRHRDEEINKRRNISTYSHEGVSEDAMDIELSNATNSNDNRPRDFLINHAAPGNKSKNSNNDDKAKSVPRDNIKDNVASDILSRDTIEPSAPSDTQHNREIYTVIGTHLKKCTQHVQTTIARYDSSFRGKTKITLKLSPDQTSSRKGKNLIKIWMLLSEYRISLTTIDMLNQFTAEAEFKDYIDANLALEKIEKIPEPKKLKSFIEQRAMISRGVISDWPLSIEDLWSVIQDRTSIIGVERMYRRKWISEEKRSVLAETDNIIVTFKGAGVRDLKIFNNNIGLKVRPFVPQTRQCFNCYRFGHTKVSCKSETQCIVCGDKAHRECNGPVKCRNCGVLGA